MTALKAKKPAAESARGLPGIVQLGRQNNFEANLLLSKFQGFSRGQAAHAFTAGARA
jgi:hypothetical protein